MGYYQFDIVTLVVDLPEENLYRGMKGTILDFYTHPSEAYEVEFCDDKGGTIMQIALALEQIA